MSDGTQEGNPEGLSPETLALAEKGREGFTAPDGIQGAAPTGQKVRPDHIPEQFWDGEKGEVRTDALLKSYTELRKTFDGRKPDEKKEPAEGAEDGETPIGIPEKKEGEQGNEPSAAVTAAIASVRDAYAQTGELTEENIKSLEAVGFDRASIDTYMAGVKALEAGIRASVYEAAGGEAEYKAAVAWAAEHLDEKEITAYNSAINTEDTRGLAVAGLVAKYRSAVPSEGTRISGDISAATGDVYRSASEFTSDLRKAEDANDPVARRKAIEKLDRSRKAGTVTRVGDRSLNNL